MSGYISRFENNKSSITKLRLSSLNIYMYDKYNKVYATLQMV